VCTVTYIYDSDTYHTTTTKLLASNLHTCWKAGAAVV